MSLATFVDQLKEIQQLNTAGMSYEIRKLEAIRDWALSRLDVDYKPGDRIVLTRDLFADPDDGRSHYAEAAHEGATATVHDIDFNAVHNYWYAEITLDVEWSASDTWGTGDIVRHWHGPVADTPEGMNPPSEYDQERYPLGRKHTFFVHVQHIRKAPND
jgi:hypothetical protein